MIENKNSGTLNYSNLTNLNYLYTVLKNSFSGENNVNNVVPTAPVTGMIFNVNNPNNPQPSISNNSKPFVLNRPRFVKGQKIFNITKESNPFNRRKSVKIIYNNEEDNESNELDDHLESNENFEIKNEVHEEHYENGDNHEKQEDHIYEDETFDWIHNNFLNK